MSGISDDEPDYDRHSSILASRLESQQREQIAALTAQLTSQAATIERLRAALAVYANERNWVWSCTSRADWWKPAEQGWERAAAALGCSEGEGRG